jgi:hypothetical protein
MSKEVLAELPTLLPIDFFNLEIEASLGKKLLLPDTSELLNEESFSKLFLTCLSESLVLHADIKKPFEECFYPEYEHGDSLELFIDTRDLKTAGFMTRFCHHFLILTTYVKGVTSREITRFRTEDVHPLCDPLDLEVKASFSSSHYSLEVSIPAHCLHGYDPASFNRIGFTYRLNRPGGSAQHFSVSSHYYSIAQHPSLWATIQMRSS